MEKNVYITLREISDELYDSMNHNRRMTVDDKQYKNYYRNSANRVQQILKTLKLMPYQKYIKSDSKGYRFSKTSKLFIKKLLESYTNGDFKKLRRGQLNELPDSFIVWLVEGIIEIFKNAAEDDKAVEEVEQILWNYTDYPRRRRNLDMIQPAMRVLNMVGKIFTHRSYSGLTPNDNCLWLDRFRDELEELCRKWEFIYDIIGELRIEEINNSAEEAAKKINEQQQLVACLEFGYAEELNEALEKDPKLKKLKEDYENECRKRTGCSMHRDENLTEARRRISKRIQEIRTAFFRSKLQDETFVEPEEPDIDLSFLSSSSDILNEALNHYSQDFYTLGRRNVESKR